MYLRTAITWAVGGDEDPDGDDVPGNPPTGDGDDGRDYTG